MHDTDTIISNITGSKDYVKELEKVTGNMETIDKTWFRDVNNANELNDREIRKILNKISAKCENFTLAKDFFKVSIAINYPNAILYQKKKNGKFRVFIDDQFKPRKFIKTEYFKLLKKIEKTANNLLEAYGKTEDKLQQVLKTQPELPDVKNFFGFKLMSQQDINQMILVKNNAANIIDRYMKPLYDMKRTMEKNWHLLDPLFKKTNEITVANYNITQQEVKDMLYLFMIAKYRCTITDNNKYYLKLFMSIVNTKSGEINDDDVNQTTLGKMDAARFLELLDTIDLDSISKKNSVYKFATQSKAIIKRIVNKKDDESMEDIMTDMKNIMEEAESQNTSTEPLSDNNNNTEKPVTSSQNVEQTQEDIDNNNILANI